MESIVAGGGGGDIFIIIGRVLKLMTRSFSVVQSTNSNPLMFSEAGMEIELLDLFVRWVG